MSFRLQANLNRAFDMQSLQTNTATNTNTTVANLETTRNAAFAALNANSFETAMGMSPTGLTATPPKGWISDAGSWFSKMSWSDLGHLTLDVIGFVPGVGEAADIANAAWYASQGKYLDAGLSVISLIPGVGDVIGKGGRALSHCISVGGKTAKRKAGALLKQLENINVDKFFDGMGEFDKLAPHAHKIKIAFKQYINELKVISRTGHMLNDVSASARRHILQGDASGGGHKFGAGLGKSEFPEDWSDDMIMHAVSEIGRKTGGRPGAQGRIVKSGSVNGVHLKVVLSPRGDIITGYPKR